MFSTNNFDEIFYSCESCLYRERSKKFDSPLHAAIRSKDIDCAKNLLRSGAEVNALNIDLETPLHVAVKLENETITRLLLENGADIFVKGLHQLTPLHHAAYLENDKILKFLLDYSSEKHFNESKEFDVDIPDVCGNTPLYFATYRSNINNIELLLKYKANANYMSNNACSPFRMAFISKKIKSIATFLDCGVDINMTINEANNFPDYINCSCIKEINILIENHIIKLKVAGFPLNKHLQSLSGIYETLPFHKECEEEVGRMKQKISGTTVSYHDILLNRSDKRAYGSNKNITLDFESNCYKMDFPIYASMIERQYRKGVQRQKLMEEGRHFLESLCNRLPDMCVRKILSFLSDDELQRLNSSC